MNVFLDANICLDLLDTTRPTSAASVAWYMARKDDVRLRFYFSGDFITTIYYILTERRAIDGVTVVRAIDALSMEVIPFYLNQADFVAGKNSFYGEMFGDFEDLMILHSAQRAECDLFLTQDRKLLGLGTFGVMRIGDIGTPL